MKKFLITLCAICISVFAFAQTETLNWYIGDDVYATTTCESGNDILLPTTPTKRGYTFNGWIGYTPIEYLESTGTQCIDSGVTYGGNDFTVEWRSNDLGGIGTTLFACSSFDPFSGGLYSYSTDNKRYYYIGNTRSLDIGYTKDTNVFNTWKIESKNHVITTYKNNSLTTTTEWTGDILTDKNIYLFCGGVNESGALTQFSQMKLSMWKIYDRNGTLVRDFIPVLDPDGTPCLYDKVERNFYYNAGTGQFIAGPVIGE